MSRKIIPKYQIGNKNNLSTSVHASTNLVCILTLTGRLHKGKRITNKRGQILKQHTHKMYLMTKCMRTASPRQIPVYKPPRELPSDTKISVSTSPREGQEAWSCKSCSRGCQYPLRNQPPKNRRFQGLEASP